MSALRARRPCPETAAGGGTRRWKDGQLPSNSPLRSLYNGWLHPGEHLRRHRFSNWTELDVWQYIAAERLEVPSIYFAHRRSVLAWRLPAADFRLQHLTTSARALVVDIDHRLDVTSLERVPGPSGVVQNEIVRTRLRLSDPIFADAYRSNRATGSAILVDEATKDTVAAVLILDEDGDWP